jgi:NTP pyrophosphatase (non-canonical NTP hydrolase)
MATLNDYIAAVAKFRDERGWARFHSPENLAKSIMIEGAELLECFQWDGIDGADWQHIEDELADVMIYCLSFASAMGIDLDAAITRKMRKNAEKYPVDGAEQLTLFD